MYIDNARNANLNRDFIDEFGGFNHNLKIGENEFYDIKNMSAENYPLLSSSKFYRMQSLGSFGTIRGIDRNGNTIWYAIEASVSGHPNGVLRVGYHSGSSLVTYDLGDIETENVGKERQMINFGAYIIVMPDKFYINTADTDDKGSVEKVFRNIDEEEHYNRWYVVKPCDIDGNEFVADSYSATEPDTSDLPDGYIWYDLNEKVIKQWSNSYSMWLTPTIYHKYRIQGIGTFKEGDGVKIRRYHDNEEYSMTTSIVKAFSNGEVPISETPPMDADYIIIPSADDMTIHWKNWNSTGVLYNQWRNLLSVEQKMPKMDYLCECQGRLWGCRYGDTQTDEIRQYRSKPTNINIREDKTYTIELNDGETVGEVLTYWLYDARSYVRETNATITYTQTDNTITVTVSANSGTLHNVCLNVNYTVLKTQKLNEIYSSKQQDFKCWDYFQGTALDSYTVSIGASGRFTGAINFNGKPLFSKEDRMFVIYGNYPAQYQLQENIFEGVEYNAHKSMVVYNGVLYYKGVHGIYAYNGGLPQRISYALGKLKFDTTKAISTYTAYPCCAMAYNGCYYINLENENYGGMYTYDIERGIWHRRELMGTAEQMVSDVNKACVLTTSKMGSSVSGILCTVEDDDDPISYAISWYAITGLIGLNTPDMKYITKVTMRYKGECTVEIKYDSTGDWIEVAELEGGTTSKTFDIIPDRCDHFQLRFSGHGEFYLYSIAKTNSAGSDVTYGNV